MRPLRKFDYYINDLRQRASADRLSRACPFWFASRSLAFCPGNQASCDPTLDLAPTPGDRCSWLRRSYDGLSGIISDSSGPTLLTSTS